MNKSSIIITLMGVDGSGKSTLISKIKKDYSKKFKVIKYLHLKPYLYLFDKRAVIKNPHKKKLNSNFLSIIKLFFWLIEYKFFYLIYSKKENQLIIFDRYVHDILVDPIRYQVSLSNKILKKIVNLFPEPDIWFVLNAKPKTIFKRKNELSIKEISRQNNLYKKIFKNINKAVLINTNLSVEKNMKTIIKKINLFTK